MLNGLAYDHQQVGQLRPNLGAATVVKEPLVHPVTD